MKMAQVETGVPYAYTTSPRDAPQPVVALDTTVWHVALFRDFLHRADSPCLREVEGKRCAANNGFGVPAVTLGDSALQERRRERDRGDVPQHVLTDLCSVTLAEAKAMTIETTSRHRPVPGHEYARLTVIDPRYIVGPWDESWQRYTEDRENAEAARARAEQERKDAIVAYAARDQRLVDLGVRLQPAEQRHWGAAPPTINLTPPEFERLLSLIPEGTTYVSDEPWEYDAPEGRP